MTAVDTLVKHAHGLVSAPDLHLHEVRLSVRAFATHGRGLVHVFPRGSATHDVIDGLTLRPKGIHIRPGYGPGVWAGGTDEDGGRGVGRRPGRCGGGDLEECAVEGAEPHGARRLLGFTRL